MPSELDSVENVLWARHANPMSGWTRAPTGAVLVYAVYRRDWRLLLAGVLWAAIYRSSSHHRRPPTRG